jgi:predicted ATPase
MLKSWFIQNFKPILDSGDLPLAPVTVLAGRNSSGKSSLIQSILMITQTLSSRILDRALLPNGPIIQLGTFEDILSEQTNLRTLEIGFELEMETEKEGTQPLTNTSIRPAEDQLASRFSTDIKSVKISAQFRSATNNGTSTSAIEASKVTIESVSLDVTIFQRQLPYHHLTLFTEDETDTLFDFRMDIKRLSPEELKKFTKNVSPEYSRLIPYATTESNYLGEFTLKSTSSHTHTLEPSLITFSHFLPRRLTRKYKLGERLKIRLLKIVGLALEVSHDKNLKKLIEDFFKGTPEAYTNSITFPDSAREAIADLCQIYHISNPFSGYTLNEFVFWYLSLEPHNIKKVLINEFKDIITQVISGQTPQFGKDVRGLEIVSNNIYAESLEKAVDQVTQFFTSKIRYLGPLRAYSQTAQKFAPTSELDDVGPKGEYAAAVYDANQNAVIQWYNPLTDKIDCNTLKVALDTWVHYLGVADEVQIQMAGQSGVSWQIVQKKGDKARPLTAVGVGVSQILPIIVMGLLAPSHTLLLIEQPELHLHPKVQARLGDFFMGLAKCGKQCLIETHSENLISQLRYHIVQAGGQEKSDCLIYFVDQDERGAARFHPIEISPQGNILNWPDGFFDETMLQEDRITAAALKKRAKKSGYNDEYRSN